MKKPEEVEITVSQLQDDLANGLVWLHKDDVGFGSIQKKYDAEDIQILTIQKHPKLVGLEPVIPTKIFIIRDDTKNSDMDFDGQTTVGTPEFMEPTHLYKELQNIKKEEAGNALINL